jgi:hypothetical protein
VIQAASSTPPRSSHGACPGACARAPFHPTFTSCEHRGALRGIPGSAYPQPEPNATELPSSAPGRPKLIELQAPAPSPSPTRAEEHIASAPPPAAARRRKLHTLPGCRPHRASRPRLPPRAEENSARRRAEELAALRALAHCPIRAQRHHHRNRELGAARLPICKACMKCGTVRVVRTVDRQGTAPLIAYAPTLPLFERYDPTDQNLTYM